MAEWGSESFNFIFWANPYFDPKVCGVQWTCLACFKLCANVFSENVPCWRFFSFSCPVMFCRALVFWRWAPALSAFYCSYPVSWNKILTSLRNIYQAISFLHWFDNDWMSHNDHTFTQVQYISYMIILKEVSPTVINKPQLEKSWCFVYFLRPSCQLEQRGRWEEKYFLHFTTL